MRAALTLALAAVILSGPALAADPPKQAPKVVLQSPDGSKSFDLNKLAAESFGDPEINTRIEQYELAFRMQASVPELTDLSKEPKKVLEEYGIDDKNEDGGFARNCRSACTYTRYERLLKSKSLT